jgi:hypothetical protein
MSKSLQNLLVQISKVCQKSEFQIKFENVLFLELEPAQVFGPAAWAWALAFGRPTPPTPLGPSPSLSLTNTRAPPLHLPPPPARPRRRRRLTHALPPPGAPPSSALVMAVAPPLITPRSIPFQNSRLHRNYGAPPPPPVPLRRSTAPLPLRPYKRVPWHPLLPLLLPCPSFPSLRTPSEPASSTPPPPPSPSSCRCSAAFRASVSPKSGPPCFPLPPPPLGQSSRAPEQPKAELR